MILDALDGRIARLTHTQSDFGAEYDSLVRHGVLRAGAGARDVRVGALRAWASSAKGCACVSFASVVVIYGFLEIMKSLKKILLK